MQETTTEFALRLNQALDSCPRAPEAQYGRLTWLKNEYIRHTGESISVNSVHKWAHGLSAPRPDNVRKLAQILKVDEVWLALGRKPGGNHDPAPVAPGKATGAVMTVAGLIEQLGGRVAFPADGETLPHLFVNFSTERYGLIVVVPQIAETQVTFVVPEPVKNHRVVGVMTTFGQGHSFTTDLFEITGSPMQAFGGFSVAQFETHGKGAIRSKDGSKVLRPIVNFL